MSFEPVFMHADCIWLEMAWVVQQPPIIFPVLFIREFIAIVVYLKWLFIIVYAWFIIALIYSFFR